MEKLQQTIIAEGERLYPYAKRLEKQNDINTLEEVARRLEEIKEEVKGSIVEIEINLQSEYVNTCIDSVLINIRK